MPIVVEGVAINSGDQACGLPIAIGELVEPAISCFEFEGLKIF
ncbi:hypothetical protein Krac_3324 [Ktedonobacter racemifer DSM 44963]|uniref:Uncharacterized protein n=1 Tax=Ktedonobacter racemifer DSM 44963 TaxID=485913 RepID=D6U120_KTERA|nr:hypothetical protein Krac_3324 [Ktedonobacter racemifer DSM 44963]